MARDFSLKQFPRERSTMPYGRPQAAATQNRRSPTLYDAER